MQVFSIRIAIILAASALLLLQGCSSNSRNGLSGQRHEVVSHALAQIGTPYRYGGSSPSRGFDCSGLVQYTHKKAGITVPRVTNAQKRKAKGLRRSKLQPGDLVFFNTGISTNHVGIMIDTNRFVHAPSSGKRVQIASLSNPYWKRTYNGAATYLN